MLKRTSLLAVGAMFFAFACDPDEPEVIDEIPPPPPPNVDPNLGCAQTCHGDAYSIAPPKDLDGYIDTSLRSVGAHRSHLLPDSAFYLNVECRDCHIVPGAVGDPTHIDGDDTPELTFGDRATYNGQLTPTFDGQNCTNVYCHGATVTGGQQVSPSWTQVTGERLSCGSCHGLPPPEPHAQETSCGDCHPSVQPGNGPNYILQAPNLHIDGKVDTQIEGEEACWNCHGSPNQPAPPTDLAGNTDYTYAGVGAHQAHVQPSDWHQQLYCTQCHILPVTVDDPGHRDGDNQAELIFDGLNPNATYDFGAYTCDNLYCHGNGQGDYGTMVWTENVDIGCNSCHTTDDPNQMSGRHDKHTVNRGLDCVACHYNVVDAERNFVGPQYHINGYHNVEFADGGTWDGAAYTCDVGCHNVQRKWYGNGNNEQ